MGAYLSQPHTTKTSSDGGNSSMGYGFSAMQGWRVSMEVRREVHEWGDHVTIVSAELHKEDKN